MPGHVALPMLGDEEGAGDCSLLVGSCQVFMCEL